MQALARHCRRQPERNLVPRTCPQGTKVRAGCPSGGENRSQQSGFLDGCEVPLKVDPSSARRWSVVSVETTKTVSVHLPAGVLGGRDRRDGGETETFMVFE